MIFFVLGITYCPSVVSMITTLVRDKEQRQREGMAMMGMNLFT